MGAGISSRLQSLSSIPPTGPEHAAHPALGLVSAMVPWRVLEPSDQVFDWSQMDANVEDARANGYDLIVRVMAGRVVPPWLLDAAAPVHAASVRILGTDQNAIDYCDRIDVPLPWDPVLRAQYAELMDELGRWLEESDGAGGRKADHVQLVPISMPTALGSEMVVGYGTSTVCPSGTDGAGLNLATENRAVWDAVSTETARRAWTEAAWRDAIAIHMAELPADVGSVLAYGAMFNDAQAAALRIASSEVADHPDRLWSMYTNLQPLVRSDGSLGPWRSWCSRCHEVITAAIASGGKVAFQTAAGGANSTLDRFRTAADDALATYGMRFLETQPINVDRYQDYLLTGPDALQDRMRRALEPPPPPPEPHATSTRVSCTPATVGVTGGCTATVDDAAADPSSPTGTVTWASSDGSIGAPTCELAGGGASASCSIPITPSAAGAVTVSATYGGSPTHLVSAGDAALAIARRATTTTVACTTPVTLPTASGCTATVTDVTGGAASAPTGSVGWTTGAAGTFSAASCTLAPISGTASRCAVSYSGTTAGMHPIAASYAGDAAHDGSGGATSVTVQEPPPPPPGDSVAPTVRITSPADGATVRKNTKVSIAATASDNIAVARVVFTVNSVTVCTDTTSPWSCTWTVPKTASGRPTIAATAIDAAGNTASHSITVTIR
jgi:hypothetical protein